MTRRRTVLAASAAGLAATGIAHPAAAHDAVEPARAALRRLIGRRADQLTLSLTARTDTDTYRVSDHHGRPHIEATTPATILTGFHRYLGETLHAGIWWAGTNLDHLPARLPAPATPITGRADVPHRFALNDTNDGYTGPYRDLDRWRHEVDILALHGFNEILVYLGADAVYRDTLREFGYTDDEVRAWIPAPAHQPWWLLQNMSGFGGPVAAAEIEHRADTAAALIDHIRALGMTPVLPGYFGTVPPDFADRNTGAHVVPQGSWCGFTRPGWLDPRDDHFTRVAAAFYRHSAARYGDTTMYKMDLLHEGGTAGDVPVGDASRAVETALRTAHPDATWVILGWQDNPKKDTIAAVDTSRMLIVDGLSEHADKTDRDTDWSGTPYAFGTIFNYGGKSTLGACTPVWIDKYRQWRDKQDSALTGIALMPEAGDNNAAALDLFASLAWTDHAIDARDWYADYAARRYGHPDRHATAAWQTLRATAYALDGTVKGEPQDSLFAAQPSLSATSGAGWSPDTMQYDGATFDRALPLLLAAHPTLRHTDAYRYDLVDIARQTLTNRSRILLPQIAAAYHTGDTAAFDELTAVWLSWMQLLERLVASRGEFLLGPALAAARRAAGAPGEFDQRTILTVWGDRHASQVGGLHDYANREWHGLIGDVYHDRWRRYFDSLRTALTSGRAPAPIDWYALTDAWARRTNSYRSHPTGDEHALATAIHRTLAADTHQVPVTVTAEPAILVAGSTTTLTAHITNASGLSDVHAATLTPAVPDGATATPLDPTGIDTLRGGTGAAVRWQLTAPTGWHTDQPATTLTVRANYRVGRASGHATGATRVLAGAPITDPYRTVDFNDATFAAAGTGFGIFGGGRDMWGGTNQFAAIVLPGGLPDGATATVRVVLQDPTGPWARAGLVVRNSLAKNGALGYANLAVTPAHGCALSVDDNGDGRLNKVTATAGPVAPVTLRLTRTGATVTAAYRTDGTDWTSLGTARPSGLAATPEVGIFMTAANGGSGATGIATFDTVSVH
ncbi:hypothetical protein Athai_29230 [Actinocatenispora thailandica]|uniref:Alpha-N-acetylglucosaminidase n=1 Tax=Actinocatenispora thailandica TaxID=227318 RepID=A0A7R7DPT8_9ACTN|nr:alpha-N-acetylglucosaminidase [Actinocatenispora thailandica]BCJ35420.1 hypothetical protein Athai_29230 [Actinocatenispora thailandica]